MSVVVDDRLADRRRSVREDAARRRLRWGIAIMVVALIAGLVLVALRSPFLAVREVSVEGVQHADVTGVLDRHGVEAGVATISVDGDGLRRAIEADPWVATADVRVAWPGAIEITVVEHVPAAWMELSTGWMLVSVTGAILERGTPEKGAPRVRVAAVGDRPGGVVRAPDALAALEFLAALPPDLASGAVVRKKGAVLLARVAGHPVDLGAPADMVAKASSVAALLAAGIPEDATISVISPARPAVMAPVDLVRAREPVDPAGEIQSEGAAPPVAEPTPSPEGDAGEGAEVKPST